MNYIVLAITAIAVAIVALIKEICNDVRAHKKQEAPDIGDEAWRLIQKQELGKSHTSQLTKKILTSNKEKS